MSFRIEMPQLSAEGESATLASWLVSEGDAVSAGDVIAELETDKSTVELESPATGTIAELAVAAGTENVAPGTLLGTIDEKDAAPVVDERPTAPLADAVEEIAEASAPTQAPSPQTPLSPETPANSESPVSTAPSGSIATPLARRAAQNRGLDLSEVEGSGAHGRIVEADVLTLADGAERTGSGPVLDRTVEAPSVHPSSSDRPHSTERLSAMRRTIARRMTESKQSVPHFYLGVQCRMDELIRTRARLNEELSSSGKAEKISINDFIVKAAALAMRDVPAANVSFAGDQMNVFECVDVAVAVATDGGLVTPVIRDADRKGLLRLTAEMGDLAERARKGKLRPEEYQGGTLTISNLGMFGIETVYPILNPPQACILGVGAAEEQPIVRDGKIEVGRVATLTLAADHRAIDGAVGAQWLAAVKAHLEDPMGMVL